jgi:GTPase Era involved in 16S rRNA processing
VIIVVNKIDQVPDKTQLLPFLARLGAEGDFAAIVPVSAMRGAQLDALLAETRKHLPNRNCSLRRTRSPIAARDSWPPNTFARSCFA